MLPVWRTPLAPPELADLPLAGPPGDAAAGEPMFRLTVAIEQPELHALGTSQPLVAGLRMQAEVLLERRRLIERLFGPVLGLTNRP